MVNVVERFLFSRFSKLVNYVQKRTGALSQRACSVGRATGGVSAMPDDFAIGTAFVTDVTVNLWTHSTAAARPPWLRSPISWSCARPRFCTIDWPSHHSRGRTVRFLGELDCVYAPELKVDIGTLVKLVEMFGLKRRAILQRVPGLFKAASFVTGLDAVPVTRVIERLSRQPASEFARQALLLKLAFEHATTYSQIPGVHVDALRARAPADSPSLFRYPLSEGPSTFAEWREIAPSDLSAI